MNPVPDQAPDTFGPYEVFERLGMGGMAQVHRAKKRGIEGFERNVALKRMLSHLAEDPNFVDSFIREAKVASLLHHPNIAQVYDFGRFQGVYYIAMELVSGFDVRKILRYANKVGEPLPMPVLLSVLGELADALEYAHSFVDEHGQHLKIVHRDISPSNLIVAHTGHLKVIDFGIAKANSRQLQTESGQIKGKLGYMSPEAALGMTLDPVSDIFSMGVVAWELVTASPLFSARTDYETMRRIREAPIVPPSYHNPACPPELDSIIVASLDRDPQRRLPSAGVFRAALDALATQHGIHHSARAVAEWLVRFAQPGDPWVRTSQRSAVPMPPEPSTAVLRPHTPPSSSAKLRRSSEQQQLATEIWGDDQPAVTAGAGPDFHMASRPGTQAPLFDRALDPLTRSLPPLVVPSFTPSQPLVSVPMYTPTAHPAPPSNRKAVLVLGVLAAIAAVLGGVLLIKKLKTAPEAPAVVAAESKLKFVVEPADAIIEIGGKPIDRDAPLDPGVYTVTVRKPGFRPWSDTVTVRAGEPQTINVVLEPGVASVSIDSEPRGLPIDVDGKRTTHRTPATFDLPAGKHALAVTSANGDVWTEEMIAEVDGKHTFTAMLPTKIADATPATNKPKKPQPASTKPRPPEEPAKPVAPPPDAAVVKPPDPEPEPPPPPKPLPSDSKPARTPVVAASAVTKLSGEIPSIKASGGESNGDVLAKMCIDEQGKVTSVKIVKSSAGIAADLQRALTSWRYRPYLNKDKQPQPVCFPLSLRLVFKRGD